MRKIISMCFRIVSCLILFVLSATAQKLPNIQETSLRAPSNIKVDGKPTEWNNQFQAYNKATEIFYTISNDDEKLYLAVQTTNLDIMNKIICGGITLSVKRTDKEIMTITFPVIDLDLDKTLPFKGRRVAGPPINLDRPSDMPAETFITGLNKELAVKSKDIAVTGIKGIQDTISIYNPEGIKAALFVDNKTSMTYELAVPLKRLGLSVKEANSFVYSIKLTGFNPDLGKRLDLTAALGTQRKEVKYAVQLRMAQGFGPLPILIQQGDPAALRFVNLVSPTDFSGEYTLSK